MGASERDEFRRAAWRVMVAGQTEPEHLLFVDEMGTNTSLASPYAWAPKGERLRHSAPRNRGPNTTLLSSMSLSGMGPSLAVEGLTTAAIFETYIEHFLAPSLGRGQIVVMDNLTAHKTARVRELIEERGYELVYLPAYSSALNPIEEAFSKIKNLLRKAEARTRGTLVEAMGAALLAVSSQDARGFFEHCGYRAAVQPF